MMKHPRRHHKAHLDFIRSLPCVVCGDDTTTEAAHLRAANLEYGKRHTGMQEKPDDMYALPLCGIHHRRQHAMNEIEFWMNVGVDPWKLAQSLYCHTGCSESAITIMERQRGK